MYWNYREEIFRNLKMCPLERGCPHLGVATNRDSTVSPDVTQQTGIQWNLSIVDTGTQWNLSIVDTGIQWNLSIVDTGIQSTKRHV
jgi:hypothetical protein